MKTLKPHKLQTLKPRVKSIATKRITGNSLYAIMRRFEQDHPRLCAECARQGLTRYGDELEHITPLFLGGAESDSNREWICFHHHKIKSAAEAILRDPAAM